MQPIAVLTDQVLQDPSILQLYKRHMCWRRNSLQRIDSFQVLQTSLPLQRPNALWTTEIRYACEMLSITMVFRGPTPTSRSRDTSPSKSDKVFAFS